MNDKEFSVYINIEVEEIETGDCLPGGMGEVTLATFNQENDAECLIDRIIEFSNSQIEGNVYVNPKLEARTSAKECRKACEVYKDWLEAGERITELEAELAEHQWVSVEDRLPEDYITLVELLTKSKRVESGTKDAYEKGFNIGLGNTYCPAGSFSHWRYIHLPKKEKE